jgi:alkylhydroperoxidase family enzyme
MISLERARELGEAMGMPARRSQSEAFRVVANNPGVARVAFSQLMQLLENNKFDARLRELMIMRIGWVTGSAYEWTNHWRVATTAGIPPEDILAVRDWRNSERLTPADRAILASTDCVSPATPFRMPPGPRWPSMSPIRVSRSNSSSPWAIG